MKRLLAIFIVFISVLAFAKGGGFSSGRSSFSAPSRSSFSAPTRSSSPSAPSRSSTFSQSTRSSGSSTGSSKSGSSQPFTTSSRGSFGNGSTPASKVGNYSPPKTVYTAKTALQQSSATVYAPSAPMSMYHYYYPTSFSGSGYSWYHYYFWYHFFGGHSHCYHNGGGQATPRTCLKNADCSTGESCDLTKKQCTLREGEWEE